MIFLITSLTTTSTFVYLKFSGLVFHEVNFFLSLSLCLIGFFGIGFNRKNLILVLLSFELIFFGSGFLLISFSLVQLGIEGQIFALLLLALAGAESVVGLSIILACSRLFGNVHIKNFIRLKG